MGLHFPRVLPAKTLLQRFFSNANKAASESSDVPKGYFAVYVGEYEKKWFVIPVSLLSQPPFQDLLIQTAEEYGFDHPMGGLTITCSENSFIDLISQLGSS